MVGKKRALRCQLVACAACLVLSMATPAMAAVGTFNGSEDDWGGPDGFFLIVARVAAVGIDNRSTGRYHAVLEPLATIAGTYDASAHASLTVQFRVDVYGASVRRAPSKGATVLAVIQPGIMVEDDKEPANWAIPHMCTFMEDGSSMMEVGGLGDARILKTIETLRERRVYHRPTPYPDESPPTSQPTTRPAGSN